MASAPQPNGTYVAHMASLEDSLAAVLSETADQIAHTESFDSEQRAEVYTILNTLKANTETHRAMVKLLAAKIQKKQDA